MERNLTKEFLEIVKTVVVPQLKEIGFKKKNLNFNRVINGLIQSINIQKSQYNHLERVLFTMNIGFYNSSIFQISKNKIDEPQFITPDNCFVWGRTGHLIYNNDTWYELNLNKQYHEVLMQIENDLKNHVIPLFQNFQAFNSLLEFLRITPENRPFHLIANIDDVAVLELEFGDFEKGKIILLNEYKKAIIPKSTSHKTVYPNGKEEIIWSEPSVNSFHVDKLIRIAGKYKINL